MTRRVAPVEEKRFRLEVDGRMAAAWTCTPERLEELAAGWLLTQGRIRERGHILGLELFADDDAVGVRARLAAAVPADPAVAPLRAPHGGARQRPDSLPLPDPDGAAELLRQLYAGAARYQDTGGIHAAALTDGEHLIGLAEDVGRHNAVDKAIGSALLEGRDMAALGLVLTARVSGAIAGKAARAGLAWVASRSIPTTLALELAAAGAVPILARAASRQPRIFVPASPEVLGVIQAGGRSRRYGSPKAVAEVAGRRLIERAHAALAAVAPEVVAIANEPESLGEAGELPTRPDARPDVGVLGGIYTGLLWARDRGCAGILTVACDMPFLSSPLLARLLAEAAAGADVAAPESEGPRGVEPLCAWYSIRCIEPIEAELARGERHVIGFWDDVRVHRLPVEEVRRYGDPGRLFLNVNTPAERERAETLAARRPDA